MEGQGRTVGLLCDVSLGAREEAGTRGPAEPAFQGGGEGARARGFGEDQGA